MAAERTMCHPGTKSARPFIASPSPNGDWFWQSHFVPEFTARFEEAGAMGRSCQFHRLLSLHSKVWSTINKRTSRSGPWASVVGQRGALPPGFWNFIFLLYFSQKKDRFLSFEKEKWKSHHFWPPWKNVCGYRWKNPLVGPGKNPSDNHGLDTPLACAIFSKLHRFTTREERSTRDEELRVHKARLQEGVRQMEGRISWRRQHLWSLHARGACYRPQPPRTKKNSGIRSYFPGVYTSCRISSQTMLVRFLHFLHAPNITPQDLDKNTSICDP